ncbi:ABC transporter ATP-binding protein [Bdellovibrio sp. HCB337]|uniref:ABC transporter ATP-binding protein n=1 Tax=Bdellovibrio sp. HCB337 TaxID=3394358 RepID=UPI0039A4342C
MSGPLYNIQQLQYSYAWNNSQVPVLKGIDITLDRGCFTCFVGPSGTGKTTLLNLMGLIENPSSGRLIFDGEDFSKASESIREKVRLKKIGFVFQSFYLVPTMTVLENTSYFLPLLGFSAQQTRTKALGALDLLGMADHADKFPGQLSGGQRQRVAIARAISKTPDVVIADEPTASLDSDTAERTIKAFQELQRVEKTSFVFSTHDARLVQYARNIYHMKDGLFTTSETR